VDIAENQDATVIDPTMGQLRRVLGGRHVAHAEAVVVVAVNGDGQVVPAHRPAIVEMVVKVVAMSQAMIAEGNHRKVAGYGGEAAGDAHLQM
jgi:hypothetical protein